MPSWRKARVFSPIFCVGKSAKQMEMSIAVMTSSTTLAKRSDSKDWLPLPSSLRNFMRLSEARLHEVLSRCMYSLHGFEPLMRPDSGQVCQALMMSSPPRSMSKPASRRARIFSSSLTLVWMKSSMSGWSTSRMTILAARRVAPPDLMVPAEASAPRMKETGPEALPPEESSSLEERMRERLRPAPEPPWKIFPSSLYQLRIESIESSTARMKQAETCCGLLVPTLNHTGELNEKTWCSRAWVSSCSKISASSGEAK